MTDAVQTECVFNSDADLDSDGAYNPATGRFNPQVAGWYQINAAVTVAASATALVYAQVALFKNGVLNKRGQTYGDRQP